MKESTLKTAILKIPQHFFCKASFGVLMAYILCLPLSMTCWLAFAIDIHDFCLITIGAAAELLAALYLLYEILGGKFSGVKELFKFEIWDLFFLALLIWSAISTLLAEDKDLALMGTGYRSEGFTTYLIYASIYLCSKLLPWEKMKKLMTAYGISFSLLSVMTVVQINPRLQSALGTIGDNFSKLEIRCMRFAAIFDNTNHYGYVLTMAILCLAGLFLVSGGYKKYIYLALFCFNLWALIINDTFGCYLASMIGLIFLVILFAVRNKQSVGSGIILLVLFAVTSIVTSVTNDGILWVNFSVFFTETKVGNDLFQNNKAGSGRMGLWKQALKYIKERPVFGHGPEGLYYKYIEDGFSNDRPHNEYLQYAAFIGIPSLVFYLGALISMLVYCLKNLKSLLSELVIIGGIIFAYCASAFFGNTMHYTSIYFFMYIGLLSTCRSKYGKA